MKHAIASLERDLEILENNHNIRQNEHMEAALQLDADWDRIQAIRSELAVLRGLKLQVTVVRL